MFLLLISMKITLTRLLLFVALLSCKRDRVIEPKLIQLTGLLKTMEVKDTSGVKKWEYAYLDSSHIKSISYSFQGKTLTEIFTYKGDTLSSSTIGDTTKTYIYKLGRLSQIQKRTTSDPEWYTAINFYYSPNGKLSWTDRRRFNRQESNSIYLGGYDVTWKGENVDVIRDYSANRIFEEYEFQYAPTLNPITRLYRETLRIPSDNPFELSLNQPGIYTSFVAGMKYKLEGKYLENRLPSTENISELEIWVGGDYHPYKQISYTYYE
jgi:hypothetical protein